MHLPGDSISANAIPLASIAAGNKGMGHFEGTLRPEEAAQQGWNLLHEDLSLPTAVLYRERIRHNLAWMQRFVAAYGLNLAPHGKTTMAPQLFALQLQQGAWGITLATAQQTLVACQHGVRRVLMANQLVGKENMSIIARLLADPDFEYYCLVDSAELVDQLGNFFSARRQQLRVLVELGVVGGRTGVRNDEQLQSVLDALARWRGTLLLSGVEIYEGVLDDESAIRTLLARAIEVTRNLAAQKRFHQTPALLSGAGSAWYDVVADAFAGTGFSSDVQVILRPGCYLTHDAGPYREAQEKILRRNPVARQMHSGLVPALHIWAYVQSRPEEEKAIVGMGKRDAAFDAGLPTPALRYRPGDAAPAASPPHWRICKMMDQHAYLQIAPTDDLRVGDMLAFDISHPCLTFDKWRTLPMLDGDYRVVDVIQTWF
ncbi:MAG TPA: amino acid deaminase [Acidobacteriaceae bacterium]|jgi:D-serine dehydratase|nr:amino acid deaminase [Acidobacteriaceae bacterium]